MKTNINFNVSFFFLFPPFWIIARWPWDSLHCDLKNDNEKFPAPFYVLGISSSKMPSLILNLGWLTTDYLEISRNLTRGLGRISNSSPIHMFRIYSINFARSPTGEFEISLCLIQKHFELPIRILKNFDLGICSDLVYASLGRWNRVTYFPGP